MDKGDGPLIELYFSPIFVIHQAFGSEINPARIGEICDKGLGTGKWQIV